MCVCSITAVCGLHCKGLHLQGHSHHPVHPPLPWSHQMWQQRKHRSTPILYSECRTHTRAQPCRRTKSPVFSWTDLLLLLVCQKAFYFVWVTSHTTFSMTGGWGKINVSFLTNMWIALEMWERGEDSVQVSLTGLCISAQLSSAHRWEDQILICCSDRLNVTRYKACYCIYGMCCCVDCS